MATNWGGDALTSAVNGAVTQTVWSVGTFDVVSGATLDSISIYLPSGESATSLRMAVYTGGTSDTNPNGATLVHDTGSLTTGVSTEGWHTIAVAGSPALSSGVRMWIAARAASWSFHRATSNTGSEFVGRVQATDETGSGAAGTAFPATVDNTTQSSSGGSYLFYLTYSVPGANRRASLIRRSIITKYF
jgi:hypothetical protein